MLELVVEKHLTKKALAFGGLVRKVKWIARKYAPDRLVSFPQSGPWLVELKRPGLGAEAGQEREHKRLRAAGIRVVVLNNLRCVDDFVLQATDMDIEAIKARLASAESIFEKTVAAHIKQLEDENEQLAARVAELEKAKCLPNTL